MSDEFTTDFSESFTGNITGNSMEARINRVCTWVAEQMTSGNPHKAPLADLLCMTKRTESHIALPPDVARVVAEGIGWMWAEGQTSGDDAAEQKLIDYLRANYPQFCQDWWERERQG